MMTVRHARVRAGNARARFGVVWRARQRPVRAALIGMAGATVLNLVVGNVLLACVMAALTARQWADTAESTIETDRPAVWSWWRWAVSVTQLLWVFVLADLIYRIYPVNQGRLNASMVLAAILTTVGAGILTYLMMETWRARLTQQARAGIAALFPVTPDQHDLYCDDFADRWETAQRRADEQRAAAWTGWQTVRLPLRRKVALIWMGIPPERACSPDVANLTMQDLAVYRGLARYAGETTDTAA